VRRARSTPWLCALLALAAAPAARAQEQAPRIPIVGYELGGARTDPDDKLQALLVSVAALGDPFVETGPSDAIGQPLGTVPRLVQALDAIGYRAAVTTRPATGGVTMVVNVMPYDRVRYVFVSGNWPIQQDELQRRITVRPGRPLPPPGTERNVVLERERELVIDFLRGRGYFEATVGIEAQPGPSAAGSVDLFVHVKLGPAYPLGPITFTGNHALRRSTSIPCSATPTGARPGPARSPSRRSSSARIWTRWSSVTAGSATWAFA
jgi:hypothetical protein